MTGYGYAPQRRTHSFFIWLIAVLVVLSTLGAAALWLQPSTLGDRFTALIHPVDAEVKALAESVGLTDSAKIRLYGTQPQLLSDDEFVERCGTDDEEGAVLGCYTPEGRVFVSNITDARFDGIREVTLAHEALHAAWDRLDFETKTKLTSQLENAYDRVRTDELDERMAAYETSEPGQRANELHSILATEVADLGDDLESYYATLFTDRSIVLQKYESYRSQFTENEAQIESLGASIEQARTSLEQRSADYDAALAQYEADAAALEARRASVDRTSTSAVNAFNSELDALRQRQVTLNAEADSINVGVARLNADIDEYNSLLGVREQLYADITAGS